jgi:AraC family transcriptional regulator
VHAWRAYRGASVNGFIVTQARYSKGFRIGRHEHSLPGLTFVLDGDFTERFANGAHACDRGTLIVKPPDAAHSDAFGGAGARCLIVEVEPWRYRALREHASALDDLVVEHGGRLAGLAESVSRELAAPDALTPLAVEALVLDLLVELGRAEMRRRAAPGWLAPLRDLLEAEFRRPLVLGDVAARVGVHPSHVARVFRRHFGVSVGEYVRRLRVEHVARALATTSMPLGEIAAEAGFADQSHMSRAFSVATGFTPARFRAGVRR